MRGRRDLVKLLDFGVAKLIAPTDDLGGTDPMSRPPQTMTGQVVGTPDYISPEQARAKPVDGKTDVYALGVIAWEMILGRRPFEADNSADVVRCTCRRRRRGRDAVAGDSVAARRPARRRCWPSRRPSVRRRRRCATIIRELRGTPPPFEWDASSPGSPPSARPAGLGAAALAPAPSTLDVPPLGSSRARARSWRPRSSPAP